MNLINHNKVSRTLLMNNILKLRQCHIVREGLCKRHIVREGLCKLAFLI